MDAAGAGHPRRPERGQRGAARRLRRHRRASSWSFFLLILAGRVFGPGFGFVLGCTSLFASALMTAGVGPWLPFQMLVSAWVGMGAGLLPRRLTGRAEIAMLVGYGVVASYAFGMLMNLSGWPFMLGIVVPGHEGTAVVRRPGAPLLENLQRFVVYTLLTLDRQLGHRTRDHHRRRDRRPRPAILTTLRRAAKRATVIGEARVMSDSQTSGR